MSSWIEEAVVANIKERKLVADQRVVSKLINWPEVLLIAGLPANTARATIRKYMAQGAFPNAVRRGLGTRARLEWRREEVEVWRQQRENSGADLV